MIDIVVADAGPLIGMARVSQLSLLEHLYGSILIPAQIKEELQLTSDRPGSMAISEVIRSGWLKVAEVQTQHDVMLNLVVDAGEADAIRLAIEQHARFLIIDDKKGRKAAKSHGIKIIGTGGVLIAAKKAGLIDMVSPVLEDLARVGYRLSGNLCHRIIELAGET